MQRGVTHLSSASQRQDLHNLLRFLLFLLGGHCDWIVFFFLSHKTISYLGLISEGSSAIRVHSEVFALSHIPRAGKLVVFIVFLCASLYIYCISARLFSYQFILEGSVTHPAAGKSKGPVLLTSCYKNWHSEHEMLPLIMKELVWKVEKHQLDP